MSAAGLVGPPFVATGNWHVSILGHWRCELFQHHRHGFIQLEPVAGGVWDEESALSDKASILDSSSASRFFSFFCSFKPFSHSSDSILNLSVSCSMSWTGRQWTIASKRRQGGKVETYSDLVMGRESAEAGEIIVVLVRCERNQEEQGAINKG